MMKSILDYIKEEGENALPLNTNGLGDPVPPFGDSSGTEPIVTKKKKKKRKEEF